MKKKIVHHDPINTDEIKQLKKEVSAKATLLAASIFAEAVRTTEKETLQKNMDKIVSVWSELSNEIDRLTSQLKVLRLKE